MACKLPKCYPVSLTHNKKTLENFESLSDEEEARALFEINNLDRDIKSESKFFSNNARAEDIVDAINKGNLVSGEVSNKAKEDAIFKKNVRVATTFAVIVLFIAIPYFYYRNKNSD